MEKRIYGCLCLLWVTVNVLILGANWVSSFKFKSIIPQCTRRIDTKLHKLFDWRKRELFKDYVVPDDYEFGVTNLFGAPGARKMHRRVGRGVGSGMGGSATRGQRGTQKSHGKSPRPGFEGGQTPLKKRLKKERKARKGFVKREYKLIKIEMLNQMPDNSDVCYEKLFDVGLITKVGKRGRIFKVLGGDIPCTAKNLTVSAHAFTASAKSAIEAAGGKCIVLSPSRNIPLHIVLKEKQERNAANLIKLKVRRALKLKSRLAKQAVKEKEEMVKKEQAAIAKRMLSKNG